MTIIEGLTVVSLWTKTYTTTAAICTILLIIMGAFFIWGVNGALKAGITVAEKIFIIVFITICALAATGATINEWIRSDQVATVWIEDECRYNDFVETYTIIDHNDNGTVDIAMKEK